MPAQVRRIGRHSNVVAGSDGNPVMTAGTYIGLGCLVGLDSSHVDDPETPIPQTHR